MKITHKAILYIGSESYDAPAITVLQGLQELGFEICVIAKPNINSWFCNVVVPENRIPQVDFVLSDLHWGTRWSRYATLPRSLPRVMIDGDDEFWGKGWEYKFGQYWNRYRTDAPDSVKIAFPCPYRWVEPLNGYEPDVLFVSHKQAWQEAFYLPFGITREYLKAGAHRRNSARPIDFLHVPGHGKARARVDAMIHAKDLPGVAVSRKFRSTSDYPDGIPSQGNRVHSWWRWGTDPAYFDALKRAKVLIYPVLKGFHWDSKRPYEALAAGCMLLMQRPRCDQSDYPLDEAGAYFEWPGGLEMACNLLLADGIEAARRRCVNWAALNLTPRPLAEYFLRKVTETC